MNKIKLLAQHLDILVICKDNSKKFNELHKTVIIK